jgi:hypothetical protein
MFQGCVLCRYSTLMTRKWLAQKIKQKAGLLNSFGTKTMGTEYAAILLPSN